MRIIYRLLENPIVYQAWQAPFVRQKLAPVIENLGQGPILDVGCGPGTNTGYLVPKHQYLGVDINPAYINDAKRRFCADFMVADVTRAEIPNIESFNAILLNSLLHHLSDIEVTKLLNSLAKQIRKDASVHVVELVLPTQRGLPYWLARLDRGDFPRPLTAWQKIFSSQFKIARCQPFELSILGIKLWQLVYFELKTVEAA